MSEQLRIVIVGGVAGGMSAATRARRLHERASITVLEKGGFVSFANCGLPYHIAGRIEQEAKLLVATPESVKARFNIDALVRHEATRVDRAAKRVEVDAGGARRAFAYDRLILATGADPIVPPIEHVRAPNVFMLRSMEDTRAVQRWLRERAPRRAAIVGAGFIGIEMTEALRDRGVGVTLIEKNATALPPLDRQLAPVLEAELRRNEVTLLTGDGLKALHADQDGRVREVELESGRRVACDGVLLSIGVRPNARLAVEAGLTLGPSGAIAVNAAQQTSDPDIYAVGDVSESIHGVSGKPARIPLGGPANRQGRIAGEHAATGRAPPAGRVNGTAIVKAFDVAAGVTGLGETAAAAAGFQVDVAYATAGHHASYYPGAQTMRIKLIFDRATGKVLGAQAAGGAGVDKRLDVVSTLIHFGGTIDDLAQLDLAYAPQFGSAKDPLHMAAFIAQNQRRELMPAIGFEALDGQVLLDVRSRDEFARGTLPGAINIPVDELRGRLGELDRGRATVTFCQVGQRGYVAQRILLQHGFGDVKNLKGGYGLASLQPRRGAP